MLGDLKKFIKKLQSSDETTKKRWLIGLSAGAMIVIIFLWVTYLNLTIEDIAEPSPKPEEEIADSFWPVFKRGAAIIYGSIAQFFEQKISEERTFIITNEKRNVFQREGAQKIQPREIK